MAQKYKEELVKKDFEEIESDNTELYNNFNTDERNEISYGGRIEAKIKKIQ